MSHRRQNSLGVADRYYERFVRRGVRRRITTLRASTWLAIDRIAAGRTRTIAGVLVQSVPRILEIGQQTLRQPSNRLFLKPRQRIAIELAEIVVGQIHGSSGWVAVNSPQSNTAHAQTQQNRTWHLSLHL